MEKLFKAKIPFSTNNDIFNPGDKEPGRAPAHLVDAWEQAGYCEIVGEVEEEIQIAENEVINEAPIEPVETLEDVSEQLPEEPKETPAIEENEPKTSEFATMKYPALKKAAKDAGIKGYNTMKQVDLIKVLEGGN